MVFHPVASRPAAATHTLRPAPLVAAGLWGAMKAQSATSSPAARRQTFDLVVGESYAIHPPQERRPGVVYLSGVCKLLSISADGFARFESARNGETFTVKLKDDKRITRF